MNLAESSSSEEETGEEQNVRRIGVKSALCVVPPESIWQPIQDIRKDHDKAFGRWMPHINLLYPFYQESCFEDIAKELEQPLSEVPPFAVSLKSFEFFPNKRVCTVWLKPVADGAADAWHVLFAKLAGVYPECVSSKDFSEFQPHLSVGQWKSSEVQAAEQQLNAGWRPLSFTINEVYLISRRGHNGNFEIRKRIPLKK